MVSEQRTFFNSGKTRSIDFRIEQLQKLKKIILENESKILEALRLDLGKSNVEGYISEISFVYKEIDHALRNIRKWAKAERVSSGLSLFPAKSEIIKEPFGVVLIIAPWNYPFQLLISPLIGAMAAGNTAILKPSEISAHTEKIVQGLINSNFDANYIHVVTGGKDFTENLLKQKFDFIFYTGNSNVGKVVMKAASENLTPVCLELGGKSPCIVDETADLELSAKRIVWGKFFNAGQTCVAPDYIYVHEKIRSTFITLLKKYIREFYSENEKKSADYGRIISENHFDRLTKILQGSKILYGGDCDKSSRYFSPTLLETAGWDEPCMKEEIFGPLLPILSYTDFGQLLDLLKTKEKPLAVYHFSTSNKKIQKILDHLSFGGGCINDCLLQVANINLPFGGVGASGMGGYHGKFSFDIFSHKKGIVRKSRFFDPKFRYPPYTEQKAKLIKKL